MCCIGSNGRFVKPTMALNFRNKPLANATAPSSLSRGERFFDDRSVPSLPHRCGAVVSLFAILGDVFRPKSFAGLFGAAPSIALATLGLTIQHSGKLYAAIETRSMIAGALAMAVYAAAVSWVLLRFKPPALAVTLALLPVWFGVSFGLWQLCPQVKDAAERLA